MADYDPQCLLDEFNRQEVERMTPIFVLFGCIILFGCLGNAMSLYIYSRNFQDSNSRCFLIMLSAVELFSSSVSVPMEIYNLVIHFNFTNDGLCKGFIFTEICQVQISSCLLILIAVDRWRKVCHPFGRQMSVTVAKVLCVMLIPLACLVASPSVSIYGSRQFYVEPPAASDSLHCNKRSVELQHANSSITNSSEALQAFKCSINNAASESIFPTLYSAFFWCFSFIGTGLMSLMYAQIIRTIKQQDVIRERSTRQHADNQSVNQSRHVTKYAKPKYRPQESIDMDGVTEQGLSAYERQYENKLRNNDETDQGLITYEHKPSRSAVMEQGFTTTSIDRCSNNLNFTNNELHINAAVDNTSSISNSDTLDSLTTYDNKQYSNAVADKDNYLDRLNDKCDVTEQMLRASNHDYNSKHSFATTDNVNGISKTTTNEKEKPSTRDLLCSFDNYSENNDEINDTLSMTDGGKELHVPSINIIEVAPTCTINTDTYQQVQSTSSIPDRALLHPDIKKAERSVSNSSNSRNKRVKDDKNLIDRASMNSVDTSGGSDYSCQTITVANNRAATPHTVSNRTVMFTPLFMASTLPPIEEVGVKTDSKRLISSKSVTNDKREHESKLANNIQQSSIEDNNLPNSGNAIHENEKKLTQNSESLCTHENGDITQTMVSTKGKDDLTNVRLIAGDNDHNETENHLKLITEHESSRDSRSPMETEETINTVLDDKDVCSSPEQSRDTINSPATKPSKRQSTLTRRPGRSRNVTIIMLAITISSVICYLPYLILSLLRSLITDFEIQLNESERVAYNLFVRSMYFKSVLNPIIYGLFDTRYRQVFLKIIKGRLCLRA